jgi:xylan 1,4-beta-xylosidase
MSYWTYSDLFEEPGPPPTPFHGGFGLMNREGIRKPAWFAYRYLHALRGKALATGDPNAKVAVDGHRTAALVWDWHQPVQTVSNKPFYTRPQPSRPSAPIWLRLSQLMPGRYHLQTFRTGYHHNDPLTAYIGMGMPERLTAAQLKRMRMLTSDRPERDKIIEVGRDGLFAMRLPMNTNDIVLVTVTPDTPVSAGAAL